MNFSLHCHSRQPTSTRHLRPQLPINGPRLRSQLVRHSPQHGIRAPNILNSPVQLPEQLIHLLALLADVICQEGVLGLRGLQTGIEKGLMRGKTGREVCGENILWRKEMRSVRVAMY